MNHLKVRSCLIDGEAVCCDEKGLAVFHVLRRRRNEPQAFLYAFDLLELDGTDLRREPIEVRKATLASILRKSRPGVRLNVHLEHHVYIGSPRLQQMNSRGEARRPKKTGLACTTERLSPSPLLLFLPFSTIHSNY